MTPAEIKHHFGDEALTKLYDVLTDRSVRELCDRVLETLSVQQVAEWLVILKQDESE